MSDRQVRVIVKGRVQGVFFRQSTFEQASRRGLYGTVRNLPDGNVEIVVRGPDASVDELLAWAREGPPAARVDGLEITPMTPDPSLGPFRVER